MSLKVIDLQNYGNVLKVSLGDADDNEYHGDDWNDLYENEAVYQKYVKKNIEFAFNLNYHLVAEEFEHETKEDFKKNNKPIIEVRKVINPWSFDEVCTKLALEQSEESVKNALKDISVILREY